MKETQTLRQQPHLQDENTEAQDGRGGAVAASQQLTWVVLFSPDSHRAAILLRRCIPMPTL